MDVFTALPLPQILIWTVVKKMLVKESGANYAPNVLGVGVLLQNISRSIRFFPLLVLLLSGFVFETAWSNFVINLVMYFLAAHIVGSCWYLFGLQRVNSCLENSCDNESTGFPAANGTRFFCFKRFLDCGADGHKLSLLDDLDYKLWLNYTSVGTNCLVNPANSPFSYGIYLLGIPVILENSIINKYTYTVFWGFQQISTLAGNLEPSIFVWEVWFTMGIQALGVLLFAILIGNLQSYFQGLQCRKLEMLNRELKQYNTEAWMKRRALPWALRKRVKDAGQFRWVATGGLEEQELMKDLPEDLQKDIQRYLCLELVKNVELFKLLEDHVLDAICERLYQKLYIEHSEIFREKKPVERMLFIVRGKLESRADDGSVALLKDGDFAGEELLAWYIDKRVVNTKKKLIMNHPMSTRTVRCLTSVDAFSLDAEDLDYITTHYRADFRSPRVQALVRYLSLFWRTQAATHIQKAWRFYRERKIQMSRQQGFQTPSTSMTSVPKLTRRVTMHSRH